MVPVAIDTMEVRNLRDDEIGTYAEFYNKADLNDPESKFMTEEEMRKRIFWKPTYSLDGYFTAFDDGVMVACGNVRINPEHFMRFGKAAFFDIYVLDGYFDTDAPEQVFAGILEYLETQDIELITTRNYGSKKAKVKLLERLGFEKNDRCRYAMERDPRGVEEPLVPKGYEMRNPELPEELETIHATANKAFATRENYPPFSLEDFKKFKYLQREWQPGIFMLERSADRKIVGLICSHIDENFNELKNLKRGASYLLAVVPEERKKGFGKLLTAASLRFLADRGMTTAFIGVNYKNTAAVKVYEDMGYEVTDEYQGWEYRI
jgi:ribosomal protein S18 acetylase RimI-like enzyme